MRNNANPYNLAESQKWKIYSMVVGVAIGLLLGFFSGKVQIPGVSEFEVQLCALACVVFPLVYALVATRCPSCGLRLIPFAMSQSGVGDWLNWLLRVEHCPRCGYPDIKKDK